MFSIALLLFLVLAAATKNSRGSNQTTIPAAAAAEFCPVTHANGSSVPGEQTSPNVFGNQNLLVVVELNGEMALRRHKDGWLWAPKVGWLRMIHGRLLVTGSRLDRPAPPMRSVVSEEYGDIGFQPTSLGFPSEGCWKITGRVGREELTFVTRVVEKREG